MKFDRTKLAYLLGVFIPVIGGCDSKDLQKETELVEELRTELAEARTELEARSHALSALKDQLKGAEEELSSLKTGLMVEIKQRLTNIESDHNLAIEKETAFTETMRTIKQVEDEFSEKRRTAFAKLKDLKEYLRTYDPEWAFADYHATADKLIVVLKEQKETIQKMKAELEKLKKDPPPKAAGQRGQK